MRVAHKVGPDNRLHKKIIYLNYPPSGATASLIQADARPMVLNRPFRSVAELGYTFSGTPWKNLDFDKPESGNTALLDVFCLNDTRDREGLEAGKVNLNTKQLPILKAILIGAIKTEGPMAGTVTNSNFASVASCDFQAKQFLGRTSGTLSSGVTVSGTGARPLKLLVNLLVNGWQARLQG